MTKPAENKPFCLPRDWSHASKPKVVARKLEKLLHALDAFNPDDVRGDMPLLLFNLRSRIVDSLREDGWLVEAEAKTNGRNPRLVWRVSPLEKEVAR